MDNFTLWRSCSVSESCRLWFAVAKALRTSASFVRRAEFITTLLSVCYYDLNDNCNYRLYASSPFVKSAAGSCDYGLWDDLLRSSLGSGAHCNCHNCPRSVGHNYTWAPSCASYRLLTIDMPDWTRLLLLLQIV